MGKIKAQCLAKAERQLPKIAPISGWALHYIIALDAHWPGVAGGYFRASDERRQVIAALLATKSWPMVESDAAALAEFIARASHRA